MTVMTIIDGDTAMPGNFDESCSDVHGEHAHEEHEMTDAERIAQLERELAEARRDLHEERQRANDYSKVIEQERAAHERTKAEAAALREALCRVRDRMASDWRQSNPDQIFRGHCWWCATANAIGEAEHREDCPLAMLDAAFSVHTSRRALNATAGRDLAERTKSDAAAIREALDAAVCSVRKVVGCGDNSCLFVKPKGMATNGGCRCLDGHRPFATQAVAQLYKASIAVLDGSAGRDLAERVKRLEEVVRDVRHYQKLRGKGYDITDAWAALQCSLAALDAKGTSDEGQ